MTIGSERRGEDGSTVALTTPRRKSWVRSWIAGGSGDFSGKNPAEPDAARSRGQSRTRGTRAKGSPLENSALDVLGR